MPRYTTTFTPGLSSILMALALALALCLTTQTSKASVLVSFHHETIIEYGGLGNQNIEGLSREVITEFQADGREDYTFENPSDPFGREHYATLLGFGRVDPALGIVYGSGAVVTDAIDVISRTEVVISVTNDVDYEAEMFWSYLIFPGGVGVSYTDFSDTGSCDITTPGSCASWAPGNAGNPLELLTSGLVSFSATLKDLTSNTSSTIFSGRIGATGRFNANDSSPLPEDLVVELTEEISGITLNGFSRPGTTLDYSWQETVGEASLGIFAPGQTKEVTLVSETRVSTAEYCQRTSGAFCAVAYGSFADPIGIGRRRPTAASFALAGPALQPFTLPPNPLRIGPNVLPERVPQPDFVNSQIAIVDTQAGPNAPRVLQNPQLAPTAEIPVAPTALLLIAGLLGLAGRRLLEPAAR